MACRNVSICLIAGVPCRFPASDDNLGLEDLDDWSVLSSPSRDSKAGAEGKAQLFSDAEQPSEPATSAHSIFG